MSPSGAQFLQKETLRAPRAVDAPEGKVPQAAANYGDSNQKCANCRHFLEPDECAKVDGVIDAQGHSRFWEADNAESEIPDEI